MFVLHPQLAADSIEIGDFPLSRLLLMKDARFCWLVLVPRVANASELFDISEAERRQLLAEACFTGERLKTALNADKINIAALGNMVPQLHMHVIARFKTDAAWPKPIWTAPGEPKPYPLELLKERTTLCRAMIRDFLPA